MATALFSHLRLSRVTQRDLNTTASTYLELIHATPTRYMHSHEIGR